MKTFGSLIYEGEPGEESLSGIQTADGFIEWRGSAANSQMQYFLRDHLGSVRVIAADKNTVISRSDYLPFLMITSKCCLALAQETVSSPASIPIPNKLVLRKSLLSILCCFVTKSGFFRHHVFYGSENVKMLQKFAPKM